MKNCQSLSSVDAAMCSTGIIHKMPVMSVGYCSLHYHKMENPSKPCQTHYDDTIWRVNVKKVSLDLTLKVAQKTKTVDMSLLLRGTVTTVNGIMSILL